MKFIRHSSRYSQELNLLQGDSTICLKTASCSNQAAFLRQSALVGNRSSEQAHSSCLLYKTCAQETRNVVCPFCGFLPCGCSREGGQLCLPAVKHVARELIILWFSAYNCVTIGHWSEFEVIPNSADLCWIISEVTTNRHMACFRIVLREHRSILMK